MHWFLRCTFVPLAAVLYACGGPEPLTPRSPLDTADAHYRQGLAAFEQGDLRTAQAQFGRARALDEGYPGSYVGAALVASSRGDHFEARQLIEQALHRDREFVDAHIALGRITAAEGQDRGLDPGVWLDRARRSFERAARLAPGRPEPHFYQAQADLAAGELDAAIAAHRRVVELNRGPLVARSLAEIERIQSILRASPGTRLGARIASREALTRSELAVLLLEELHLEELIRQRQPPGRKEAFRPPSTAGVDGQGQEDDLRTAWARPWIERVMALGVPGLEPMPDGSFHGDEPVTRAQYARVIEGILSMLDADESLTTRYVGEPSRFPDVRSDHYAYNAIALSVDRGIMSPEPVTGRFRPDDPVSGAEALVIVRDLQNAVRMEF